MTTTYEYNIQYTNDMTTGDLNQFGAEGWLLVSVDWGRGHQRRRHAV